MGKFIVGAAGGLVVGTIFGVWCVIIQDTEWVTEWHKNIKRAL